MTISMATPAAVTQVKSAAPAVVVPALEPIDQLVHWLTSAAVHGVIGIAIGLVAVRLMHHRHLRWTWAPAARGVDVLVGPMLGGAAAWTFGIAALCATVRGRRWHREEVQAGADLAELAANRRGPTDALRTLVRRTAPRLIGGWAPQSRVLAGVQGLLSSVAAGSAWLSNTGGRDWFNGDRLTIGEEEQGRPVTIPLGGPAGGTHTLVVGAAGSGKTVTMTWTAVRAIEHGMGAIVIDPKDPKRVSPATAGRLARLRLRGRGAAQPCRPDPRPEGPGRGDLLRQQRGAHGIGRARRT